MRSKTNFFKPIFAQSLKQAIQGSVQKKTQEKKTTAVTRKAKELLKKNLHFLMKGRFPYQTYEPPLIKATADVRYRLPQSEEEDKKSHITLIEALNQQYALHSSDTWLKLASISDEYNVPFAEKAPRFWKDTMHLLHYAGFNLNKKQLQFQELIYEIILTEQSYLDDLILTYTIFVSDSIEWVHLPDSVRKLFESMYQIIILHIQFLKALRERQSQTKLVYSITDIFQLFVPHFEIYSDYFAIFEKATNEIASCIKTQNQFGSYITRRQAWKECRNLPFSAYLLTPIQRVMKYPLFFNSLLECLGKDDLRVRELSAFISELDKVLRHFEQQQKDAEDLAKMEDLQMRIKGLRDYRLACPGRRLVYEGYLNVVHPSQSEPSDSISILQKTPLKRRGSIISQAPSLLRRSSTFSHTPSLLRRSSTFSLAPKKGKRAYVFLFNDSILFTRVSKEKFTVKSNIPPKKGSFYGPSPSTMFKMIHLPGRVTYLSTSSSPDNREKRRGSLFNMFKQPSKPQLDPMNPTHFYATIATEENITNLQLEADSVAERLAWCGHMGSVILEYGADDRSFENPKQSAFFYDSDSSSLTSEDAYSPEDAFCPEDTFCPEDKFRPGVDVFNNEEDTLTTVGSVFDPVGGAFDAVEETMEMEEDHLKNDEAFPGSIMDSFFADSIWSVGSFELKSNIENL